MTQFLASNVTLYAAGGSGDSLIPDGYVRAVEKIWLDNFTWGLTTSPSTGDTLIIGYIPANKKIIGCEVYLPATFAPSTCAISVGLSSSTGQTTTYSPGLLISYSTQYVYNPGGTGSTTSYNVVRMNNPTGMGYVVTSSTISVSGSASVLMGVNVPVMLTFHSGITAPTIGTITTILRYT